MTTRLAESLTKSNLAKFPEGLTIANWTRFAPILKAGLVGSQLWNAVTGGGYIPVEPTQEELEEDPSLLKEYHRDLDSYEASLSNAKLFLDSFIGEEASLAIQDVPHSQMWAKLEEEYANTSGRISLVFHILQLLETRWTEGTEIEEWLGRISQILRDINMADRASQLRAHALATVSDPTPPKPFAPVDLFNTRHHRLFITALLPQHLADVVAPLGEDPALSAVTQRLCAHQADAKIREAGETAMAARVATPPQQQQTGREKERSGKTNGRGGGGAKGGKTGGGRTKSAPNKHLDARQFANHQRWPHGIDKEGRFELGRQQCARCYGDGHWKDECPIELKDQAGSRSNALAKFGIKVAASDTMALRTEITEFDADSSAEEGEPFVGFARVSSPPSLSSHPPAVALPAIASPTAASPTAAAPSPSTFLGSFVAQVESDELPTALVASHGTVVPFILDSGASRHMTDCQDLLHDYQPFSKGAPRVRGAFGGAGAALGEGTLRPEFQTGAGTTTFDVKKVLYVPNLGANLLSFASLLQSGAHANFEGSSGTLTNRDGAILLTFTTSNGVFVPSLHGPRGTLA